MQVCLYSLCFSHFLFIRDSGRRDIYPFRKTNNSIPWDEVFETLKKGNRLMVSFFYLEIGVGD